MPNEPVTTGQMSSGIASVTTERIFRTTFIFSDFPTSEKAHFIHNEIARLASNPASLHPGLQIAEEGSGSKLVNIAFVMLSVVAYGGQMPPDWIGWLYPALPGAQFGLLICVAGQCLMWISQRQRTIELADDRESYVRGLEDLARREAL